MWNMWHRGATMWEREEACTRHGSSMVLLQRRRLSKARAKCYAFLHVHVYDSWEVGSWRTFHVVLAESPVGDTILTASSNLVGFLGAKSASNQRGRVGSDVVINQI